MIIGAGSPATFTLDVFCSADVAAVPKFIVDPQFMDAVGVMGVIMSSGCVALASGRAARGRVVVTGVIVEFEPEEKGGGIDGVVITALSRFEDMPSSTCVCDAWIAFSSYRCVLPISCVFTLILMFSFSPKENHTHIIKLLAVELHHLGPALIGLTQEEQRVEVRLAGFGRPEIHCVVIEKCPTGQNLNLSITRTSRRTSILARHVPLRRRFLREREPSVERRRPTRHGAVTGASSTLVRSSARLHDLSANFKLAGKQNEDR